MFTRKKKINKDCVAFRDGKYAALNGLPASVFRYAFIDDKNAFEAGFQEGLKLKAKKKKEEK